MATLLDTRAPVSQLAPLQSSWAMLLK